MKLLGFNVWRCQIDRKQELQKQAADKTMSDHESDDEKISVSSESSQSSVDTVVDKLEKTILEDDEVQETEKSDEESNQSEVETSDDEEDDSSDDSSQVSSDEELDEDFFNHSFDDDGELQITDDDGNIIFSSGKDGLLSPSRFGSRTMISASIFSQKTLIRKFAAKYPGCEKIQKVVQIITTKTFKKKCNVFTKFSVIHLNQVLRTRSFEATVNDYKYLINIRSLLGEKHYKFMKTKYPGYYRNSELAVLGLFSKDPKIIQAIAKKLLSLPEIGAYDPETHLPPKDFKKPEYNFYY